VHASTEDKCNEKDNFYEVSGHVLDQLPKYHLKILLDSNAKVGRENIFKPITENKSSYKQVTIMGQSSKFCQ
jgi:hypothetical protein